MDSTNKNAKVTFLVTKVVDIITVRLKSFYRFICWERADLLAVVYVVLSLSQMCPGPHQNQG